MKKVIGYVRVSRDRDRDKLSPDIQRTQIEDYCTKNGYSLVRVIEDIDISGKNFERPGWKELIKHLKNADGVVVISLDRFGRNLEESLRWGRIIMGQGKDLLSVHENVEMETLGGRIHYKTLLFVNDLYLEIHSQKMKDVQQHKLETGEWRGGPLPLGYMYDASGNVILEDSAHLVQEIFDRKDCGYSCKAIGDMIGISTRAVKRIIANPMYMGKRFHGEEVHDLNVPVIISEDLWYRVQESDSKGGVANGTYLLSGVLRCGSCGATMHRQKRYGAEAGMVNWVCPDGCVTIREHLVEQWVQGQFPAWGQWSEAQQEMSIMTFVDYITIHPVSGVRVEIEWK